MMTVAEIFSQAQTLTEQERGELAKLLIDSLMGESIGSTVPARRSFAEMAALLRGMEPIELVDPEITDPVEWLKAQRRKEADRLRPYWDGEK